MKTVRFAQVVEQCGPAEIHLVLENPSRDRNLQKAVKANRVMTVFQSTNGQKPDRGEVGFQAGAKRQFLVFRKSMGRFAGAKVVGIKYDLLAVEEPAERMKSPQRQSRFRLPARQKPAKGKVVPFPPQDEPKEDEDSAKVVELKAQIRRAMRHLEGGRQMAAYNILQEALED